MIIKSMKSKVSELATDRLDEVGRKLFMNKEYQEVGDNINRVYNEIKLALPEDKRKLLAMLDEENTAQFNIYLEMMYKQGLKDGLELNNINI